VGGTTVCTSGKLAETPFSGTTTQETKGHERHTRDGVEVIQFPGMLALYDRFKHEAEEISPVSWDWPE
jgi:hypothetical protein